MAIANIITYGLGTGANGHRLATWGYTPIGVAAPISMTASIPSRGATAGIPSRSVTAGTPSRSVTTKLRQ